MEESVDRFTSSYFQRCVTEDGGMSLRKTRISPLPGLEARSTLSITLSWKQQAIRFLGGGESSLAASNHIHHNIVHTAIREAPVLQQIVTSPINRRDLRNDVEHENYIQLQNSVFPELKE